MLRILTDPLDRLAIRMATASTASEAEHPAQAEKAMEVLRHPDFYMAGVGERVEARELSSHRFEFDSPLPSSWAENNIAQGRFWKTKRTNGSHQPWVVLLHGWNGELGYRWHFPYVAWRLNRIGLSVATLELPYHGRRRPRSRGAVRNFISGDLLRTVEAVRQAMADVRVLMDWLMREGASSVGLWGVSLGAWLAGLLMSHELRCRCAVLVTPVPRMDRALAELPFCEPVRRHLPEGVSLSRLNLVEQPVPDRERVLIVKSEHDHFAAPETVEELWEAWGRPTMWRCQHGHISVLLSLGVMERTVRWVGGCERKDSKDLKDSKDG